MIKFIFTFSLSGLIIPIVFAMSWNIADQYYHLIGSKLATLQLMLWPSSIWGLATAASEGIDFKMLSISIFANVLLYSLIGFLIWLGINKYKWILFVVGGLILMGWYKIFTL